MGPGREGRSRSCVDSSSADSGRGPGTVRGSEGTAMTRAAQPTWDLRLAEEGAGGAAAASP